MYLPSRPPELARPFGCLSVAEIYHPDADLRGPGGKDDDARLLHLLFSFWRRNIRRPSPLVPPGLVNTRVTVDSARTSAPAFFGVRKIGDLRIGQRADRATDMAPAVIDAGRPAHKISRVHADRRRHHTDAGRFAALLPNITIAKGFHRRHRIGFTLRPPNFLSLGVAGHANLRRNLVIVGRDVRIRDRPVEAAIVFTLHLEIVRHVAREIREIVQRRTANTPAGLIGVAVRDPLPSSRNGMPAGLTRRPQKSELIRSLSCQSGPDSNNTTFLPALASTEAYKKFPKHPRRR